MTKLYEGYERLDLTQGMRNKDKPDGPVKNDYWCAGEQMEALTFYAPFNFDLIGYVKYGSYNGDIYGIAKWFIERYPGFKFRWVLFRDSFGSCSGCDGLEGGDSGYDYVEDVLKNNTLQFLTLDDMAEYIKETKDFFWLNPKKELLGQIELIKHLEKSDVLEYYLKV